MFSVLVVTVGASLSVVVYRRSSAYFRKPADYYGVFGFDKFDIVRRGFVSVVTVVIMVSLSIVFLAAIDAALFQIGRQRRIERAFFKSGVVTDFKTLLITVPVIFNAAVIFAVCAVGLCIFVVSRIAFSRVIDRIAIAGHISVGIAGSIAAL